MKEIVLVCPNGWDDSQLPNRNRWRKKYRVIDYGDDAEQSPEDFNAIAFVQGAVEAIRSYCVDGVTSSSDYPGCLVAGVIASELGLPGPDAKTMLRCSHKYYSRLAQREAVPEATPEFALIDPNNLLEGSLGIQFPLFVKPVKSWFSQHARRVDSFDELVQFVQSESVRDHLSKYVNPFNELVAEYTDFEFNGSYMLAEELLSGEQVTLEGFVFQGQLTVVGVVDAMMYPGTISFQRFHYPSELHLDIQNRMSEIARRVMGFIGFDNGLFNIELFYSQQTNKIRIIEINPRMCGQFADLMETVNGTNTYEILLALAAGDRPPAPKRRPKFPVAASFVLRAFRDATVRRTPDRQRIAAVKRLLPVTLVRTFHEEGQLLSAERHEADGYSYRYAVINMGGEDRASLESMFRDVQSYLAFEFDEDV